MSLFRKQAIEKQHNKLWGQVNLSQPISYSVLTFVFIAIVGTALVFLFTADYHRKEQVHGLILPEGGVIQLFSPSRLLISEQLVEQGEVVVKDQALFRLSAPVNLETGENETKLKVEELQKQILLLKQQAYRAKQLAQQNQQYLNKALLAQKEQHNLLNQELTSTVARAKLNHTLLNKHKKVMAKGHISESALTQLQEQRHSLQQEVMSIKRQIKQLLLQQKQTEFELSRLPIESHQEQDQFALSISEREQELTRLQASSDVLITAPVSGIIASLEVHENQWIKAQQYMLSILPEKSSLYAELYVPTRAYGFIEKGQEARIRLDAFPFEKFGSMTGIVDKKSTHISTQSGDSQGQSDNSYKIRVKLDKQTITAYGQEVSLLSGMRLTADILVDKRNLIEWLLAPLYSLKE